MTIRRLFIVNTAVEFSAVGITIYFGSLNLKKLFISKEEIIKLEHITKSSNEASLPVEGIFRFTFKHDDILRGIGIFTNFDKSSASSVIFSPSSFIIIFLSTLSNFST